MTQPELEEVVLALRSTDLGAKPLSDQQVGLLQEELRHARTQLVQNAKQHAHVVKAWKKQVDKMKTVQSLVDKEHLENYNGINIFKSEMKNKLREGEAREAVVRDELSKLETVCSELRESAKQLETAHSDDLVKRGLELQYTQNLLKPPSGDFACTAALILPGKPRPAREERGYGKGRRKTARANGRCDSGQVRERGGGSW